MPWLSSGYVLRNPTTGRFLNPRNGSYSDVVDWTKHLYKDRAKAESVAHGYACEVVPVTVNIELLQDT